MFTFNFRPAAIGKALIIITVLVLVTCDKSNDITGPNPDPDPAVEPAITVSLSESSIELAQGESDTLTVSVTRTGGYSGAVDLFLDDVPDDVTGTFNPASVPGGSTSSTLWLDAAADAPEGQHDLTVRARGQDVGDATSPLALQVEESSPTDGEWAVFDMTNSDLPHNRVLTIAIDDDGLAWVGTHNGLAIIDSDEWTVYTTANSDLPGHVVARVAPYGQGRAWVDTGTADDECCFGNGVAHFDGENWTHYTAANSGLSTDGSHGMAVDKSGRVWRIPGGFMGNFFLMPLTTPSPGLDLFAGGNWTSYELPGFTWGHGMSTDEDGNVWLVGRGADGAVVMSNDGNGWVVDALASEGLTDLITEVAFTAMAVGGSGDIWLGTWGDGMLHYDGSGWTEYNMDNSELSHDFIRSIALDGAGGAWSGGQPATGLSHFDGERWTYYNYYNSGLPSHHIEAVAVDGHGNKWLGTGWVMTRGLAVFNENGIVR